MNHFSIVRRAVAVTLLALPLIVTAQDRGTRDEAKAMVDAAIGHIGKAGADQAFKDFADKANSAWHNKDLYVFVIRKDGIMRCPSNFVFQRGVPMPPWIAERHAC